MKTGASAAHTGMPQVSQTAAASQLGNPEIITGVHRVMRSSRCGIATVLIRRELEDILGVLTPVRDEANRLLLSKLCGMAVQGGLGRAAWHLSLPSYSGSPDRRRSFTPLPAARAGTQRRRPASAPRRSRRWRRGGEPPPRAGRPLRREP